MSDNYVIFERENLQIDGWTLASLRRGKGAVQRIYIEGDGHAYISRDTPSGDPTPINPTGLKLAMADAGPGVMYVARPCQWVKGAECHERTLWTEGRFTERVAQTYTDLVAQVSGGQPVELVGYSGGAWVALQVAARLPNVTKVTTVAGNLMPNWVNAQHKVTLMEVADYPVFKRNVPIRAFVGRDDVVVGRGVVKAFQDATGARVQLVEVDATHGDGWVGAVKP